MSRHVALLLIAATALAGCLSGSAPSETGPGEPDAPPAADNASAVFNWSPVEDARIRPGASLGGYCTFNWVFTAPNGSAYVGTAAHCTDGPNQTVHLGDGDRNEGPEVGEVVFDSDNASKAPDVVDFSLIRLRDDRVEMTHPSMIGWDGPTGVLEADNASVGDEIGVHGHGIVFHQTERTQDRPGVLNAMDNRTYEIQSPFIFGDSGGPIVHQATGQALGVVSGASIGAQVPPYANTGPTADFVLRVLHDQGWEVELVTV